MKSKVLYHGSGKRMIGNKLLPKKPRDLNNIKENEYRGIYATNIKKLATIMGLTSGRGISGSCLMGYHKNPYGIIYNGWPKNKYFYVYTLHSDSFKNKPRGSGQWISSKSVKPIKIEKFEVKDYIHLVRKPTKKELKEWNKKLK